MESTLGLASYKKDIKEDIRFVTGLYYNYQYFITNITYRDKEKSLEVVNVSHVGFSRSFRAILYGLFVAGGKKYSWLYRLLTANGKIDLPIYLNFYDIMMLVAKKESQK